MTRPAFEQTSRLSLPELCRRGMDMRCRAIPIELASGTTQAAGREITFSDLDGHSTAIEYVEGPSLNERRPAQYRRSDTIVPPRPIGRRERLLML